MNERSGNDETDRADGMRGWLIQRAARAAPAELSQRLEEEWLADLATRSGPISRLRFALGCAWATRIIALDHSLASAAVGAPAGMAPAIAPHHRQDRGLLSRRTLTFGLVAALHVAVFYAFMTGLATSFVKQVTPPLQNRTINDVHPRDLPPPPPPNLNPVKLELPRLDANVPIAEDSTQEVVRADDLPPARLPPQPEPAKAVPPHTAKLLQGGPGAGFPAPQDFYPSLARHLEEQGIATVTVCVDARGRLTTDPTLLESSGSTRLDGGALKLARAGSGHYRPTTEDGQPMSACYPFRIRFQIR